MDRLLEILSDLHPEVDFEQESNLIDNHILDSFDIVSLVSEIADEYDVQILAQELVPENFNSVEAIWDLISRKMENED